MTSAPTTTNQSVWRTVLEAFSPARNLRALLPRPPNTFAPLDGIRGATTIWVISAHCLFSAGAGRFPVIVRDYPALRLTLLSNYGNDSFFVMSGFLIARLLMREHQRNGSLALGRFFVRRAARLLPAYYLAIAAGAALGLENRASLVYNLTYVNNFVPLLKEFMPWTWSLAVEEQFYLSLPFVLLGMYRIRHFRGAFLIGLAVLSVFIRLILVDRYDFGVPIVSTARQAIPMIDVLYTKIYSRFGSLVCGVFIAYLHEHYPRPLRWLDGSPRAALSIAAAAIAVILFLSAPGTPIDIPTFQFGNTWPEWALPAGIALNRYAVTLAFSCLMVLMLGSTATGKLLARGFALRIWYPFAQLSYAAYLFHPIVVLRMPQLTTVNYGSMAAFFFKVSALTYAISVVVHLAVERPFMNLRALWPSRISPQGSASDGSTRAG